MDVKELLRILERHQPGLGPLVAEALLRERLGAPPRTPDPRLPALLRRQAD